jgi:hypothetical protein
MTVYEQKNMKKKKAQANRKRGRLSDYHLRKRAQLESYEKCMGDHRAAIETELLFITQCIPAKSQKIKYN